MDTEDVQPSEETEVQSDLKVNLTYDEAIRTFPNINDPQWKEKDLF